MISMDRQEESIQGNLMPIDICQSHIRSISHDPIEQLGRKKKKFLKLQFPKNEIIGVEGAQNIAKVIKNSLQLQSLQIVIRKNKNLTFEGLKIIYEELKSLSLLSELSIQFKGENESDNESFKFLGTCIQRLRNLQSLSLDFVGNNIVDGIKDLMEGVEYLKNLISFSISIKRIHYIGKDNMVKIGNVIKKFRNLKQLTFKVGYKCMLNEKGAISLGEALIHLKNLAFLEVEFDSFNHIGDSGLVAIFRGIRSQKELKVFKATIGYANDIIQFSESHCLKELAISLKELNCELAVQLNLKINCQENNEFLNGFKDFNFINVSLNLLLLNVNMKVMKILKVTTQNIKNLSNLSLSIQNFAENQQKNLKLKQFFNNIVGLQDLRINMSQISRNIKYFEDILSSLRGLTSFSISFNRVHKNHLLTNFHQFCQGISSLVELENFQIDLSDSKMINSEDFKSFSEAIKSLMNLKKFKLKLNTQLIDEDSKYNFIQSLSNLSNLEDLKLTAINVDDQRQSLFENIGDTIKQFFNLKNLTLKFEKKCSLQNCLSKLGNGLLHLKQLKSLKLYFEAGTKIDLDCFRHLSIWLSELKELQKLILQFQQQICQESVRLLGNAFMTLENMEKLNLILKESIIGIEGIKYLCEGIKCMKKLQKITIDISDDNSIYMISLIQDLPLINLNQFQLSSFSPLFLSLIQESIEVEKSNLNEGGKINKRFIDLQIDSLKKVNFKSFFEGIKYYNCLQYLQLNLDGHIFDNERYIELGKNLASFSLLNYLSIQFNEKIEEIGIEGQVCISQSISELKKLNYLSISLNSQNSNTHRSIQLAKSIQKLTELIELEFNIGENNDFDSECLIELSTYLQQQSKLKSLSIKINKGNLINSNAITIFFKQLSHLQHLDKIDFHVYEPNDLDEQCFEDIYAFKKRIKMKSIDIDIRHPYNTALISLLLKKQEQINLNMFQDSVEIMNIRSLYNHLREISFELKNTGGDIRTVYGFCNGLKHFIHQQKLQVSLRENVLQSEVAIRLVNSLKHMIKLKDFKLSIHQNDIGNNGFKDLLEGISHLNNMIKLDILIKENNQINEEQGIILGEALSNLGNLQHFILSIEKENNIGNKGGESLASGLKTLSKLKELELFINESNKLGYNTILKMKEAFESNLSLEKLTLEIYENSIFMMISSILQRNWKKFEIASRYFEKNSYANLDCLDINIKSISLDQESANIFSQSLKTLSQLIDLKLVIQQNNIGYEGAHLIGEALKELKQLQKLFLQIDNNDIQSLGVEGISNGIANLTGLKNLTLIYGFGNHIKRQGCVSIGKCLKYLVKLESLKIEIKGENEFDEKFIMEINESMKELINLQALEYYFCIDNSEILISMINTSIAGIKQLLSLQQNNELNYFNRNQLKTIHIEFRDTADIHKIILIDKFSIKQQQGKNKLYQREIAEFQIQLDENQSLSILTFSNSLQAGSVFPIVKGIQILQEEEYLSLNMPTYDDSFCDTIIGDYIGSITNLKKLQLTVERSKNTQDKMSIGKALSKLTKVKHLNLQIVIEIQYEEVKDIYDAIKNLKQLESLQLEIKSIYNIIFINLILNELPNINMTEGNNFKLKYFQNISLIKTDDEQLQLKFGINYDHLYDFKGIKEFLCGLSKVKNLKELYLYSNLHGIHKCQINQKYIQDKLFLKKIENEESFGMKKNNILALTIYELLELEELNIKIVEKNYIKLDYFLILFKGLSNLKSLKKLSINIQNKNIFSQQFKVLCDNLGNLSQLKSLEVNISMLEMKDKGCDFKYFLENALKYLTLLSSLNINLQNVDESEDFIESFKEILSLINDLEHLSLVINSKNKLGAQQILKISEAIKKLQKLEYLKVSFTVYFDILFSDAAIYLLSNKPILISIPGIKELVVERKKVQNNNNQINFTIDKLKLKLEQQQLMQAYDELMKQLTGLIQITHLELDLSHVNQQIINDSVVSLNKMSSLKIIKLYFSQYNKLLSLDIKGLDNLVQVVYPSTLILQKSSKIIMKKYNIRLVSIN